jgi:hypothetical protein
VVLAHRPASRDRCLHARYLFDSWKADSHLRPAAPEILRELGAAGPKMIQPDLRCRDASTCEWIYFSLRRANADAQD